MSDLFGTDEPASDFIFHGAVISPCRQYRYSLTRMRARGRRVVFAMLNPSTADEHLDDPIIRRCLGFARLWEYPEVKIVNLFAFRSTDPKKLLEVADPIGPENNEHIEDAFVECDLFVCAWGVHGTHLDRNKNVIDGLFGCGRPLMCLGKTKDGHPKHPLYLAANTKLEVM